MVGGTSCNDVFFFQFELCGRYSSAGVAVTASESKAHIEVFQLRNGGMMNAALTHACSV
jgi:hypothetical protein